MDLEETENPDIEKNMLKLSQNEKDTAEKGILNELLNDFKELLKTPYGPLGYLVMSEPEQIIKLYGVDTDKGFFAMVEGSRIRITSPKDERFFNLEKMIIAGGGKRWFGEAGAVLNDPAETQSNKKLSDTAICEIIESIKKKL